MSVCVIIPARLDSTRLPRKVLCDIGGKPMVQHVYEAVALAQCCPEVFVATGDTEVLEVVQSFGGKAVLTQGDHQSGTDRIAEVARSLVHEIVVNVQADEPLVDGAEIDRIVGAFTDESVEIATLSRPLVSQDELLDRNRVKVLTRANGDAHSFSRSAQLYAPSLVTMGNPRIHLGIYAYRRKRLLAFAEAPRGVGEVAESLDLSMCLTVSTASRATTRARRPFQSRIAKSLIWG